MADYPARASPLQVSQIRLRRVAGVFVSAIKSGVRGRDGRQVISQTVSRKLPRRPIRLKGQTLSDQLAGAGIAQTASAEFVMTAREFREGLSPRIRQTLSAELPGAMVQTVSEEFAARGASRHPRGGTSAGATITGTNVAAPRAAGYGGAL